MANKQGTNQIIDAFIGDKLIEARYIGQTKYFDAYTEITGTLPLSFNSRAAGALKNYRIYGTSAGAGVDTGNLYNIDAKDTNNGFVASKYLNRDGSYTDSNNYWVSEYMPVDAGVEYTCIMGTFTNPSLCYYDDQKNYISGFSINAKPRFTTAPTGSKFVRISVRTTNASFTCFVPGHITDPDYYVPYGYKTPLSNISGVTENLFDKGATDTNNGYLSDRYITNTGATQNNQNYIVSEYIPCNGNTTYYLSSLVNSGTATALCFYDQSYGFISGERILNATNVTSPADAAYIRTTVQKETLDSAMISEIYLPSYIPHRYTADYNIYIGSTKLGEEEYADYGEQKVYKRTENLFNKDDFILADLSLYNETKITSSTTACIIVMPCEANTQYVISIPNYDSTVWRIGLSDYEIPASNQEYTRIESEKPSGNVSTFTTLATTKNILLQIQKTTVDITKNSIMLVSGSTAPETYIPYFQPTDPPAPLPAITAYQGENTLSDPMVQTKAYSLEQGNYGGNLGDQMFKHNSSHDYFNKTLRVPSILTIPAGQKWLIATKIGWATTLRIANSSGVIISMPGSSGTTTTPIVIEASTSERKLGIHSVRFVNGSVLPCVPSDYGGDLDITVVDAGALGSMTIKGWINSMI